MIHKGPWYNPKKDLQPVDQTGVIDLAIAMADGMIPSQSGAGVVEETEDIEPSAMMSPPEDIFDRMQQSYTVRENLKTKESQS